ncbi:MAG TPA: hypothetical protein VEX15_05590 [Nocardioidaceae bacterium]|nr:hypothetical protein [Nocardioidaceae bacterium]
MRRLIAILAAVTALAVAGCGTDDAESTGGDTDQTPSSDPAGSSEPAPEVESVAVTRTGGIAGVHETWKIDPSDRGHAAVFEAASEDALADVGSAGGKPPCCDFFEYSLVIRYADGTTASYRMYDGGTSDPALDHLVTAVLKSAPVTSSPAPTLH